ncbi:ROK family protein, partial [Proteus terrae]|uniref:ROK family protein n=1 Tax=Proteus terrae TaxID=1574161 RepID=UPI001CC029E6
IFTLAIGVPGSVDPEGRVRLAPKLPALEGIALASLLRTRYGLTILVENDAKLAVLGELWAGDARGLANFAFLLVKEGIGAGLV